VHTFTAGDPGAYAARPYDVVPVRGLWKTGRFADPGAYAARL
jgi:hypothetical protein